MNCPPRNAAVRSRPCSPSVHGQPPTGSLNRSSDRAQPTLSPSHFVFATFDASSLLIPCTPRSPEQPRCWGGDVRVQEFYGKHSRSQLSSAWWIRLDVDLNKILATSQVRVWRGAYRRGARRMREGHMDASGFLYASADAI
ncbi:ty3-gypsy retrotransposon protein [Cucumis melo var. makuwa]|uniref:Ty3-gypsy retrotransposon protein n=1 Tax=Cucumis melo var. makuwa TaxID=1194695 RepID=A0A5A7TK35_CUCMM|nr:ty3-gypsy retrotransposon protein [Cucumis melo var. makuwa]TYK17853.1 ty3-gypsy retrotransposon protein [Cucumis melo var. makuwa]